MPIVGQMDVLLRDPVATVAYQIHVTGEIPDMRVAFQREQRIAQIGGQRLRSGRNGVTDIITAAHQHGNASVLPHDLPQTLIALLAHTGHIQIASQFLCADTIHQRTCIIRHNSTSLIITHLQLKSNQRKHRLLSAKSEDINNPPATDHSDPPSPSRDGR